MRFFGSLQTIRARLIILVMTAVSVSTVVVGALSLWQETTRYAAMKRDTMFSSAQVLAAATARGVVEKDTRMIYEAVRAIGRIDAITYVGVLDAAGVSLADLGATEQLAGDITIDETTRQIPLASLLHSRSIELTIPIIRGGEAVGRLMLVGDTSDLGGRLRDALASTLMGALIALMLGLIVALHMQRAITRPLSELSDAMAHVSDGHNYAVNVSATQAGEIGILARGFNTMLSDIRERDHKLAAHREHLEDEVAQRTRELVVACDAAQEANFQKSAFLATMSHEIRTPMNGMLVMAELLASSELPQRSRRYADVIAKSSHSLLAIINDILDLSKVESGKLELERMPVDPCDIVDTVLSLFSERARSKGLDLAGFVGVDIPAHIAADPVRLNQVIGNLVNNALKFTKSGGVLVSIERDPKAIDQVLFSVRDTGVGIAPENLGKIFEAFAQADQSTARRHGGTGLGLAISNKLVLAMGSQINVQSRPGEGSTFSFSLSCAIEGETAAAWPHLMHDNTRISMCIAAPLTSSSIARYVAASEQKICIVAEDALASALESPGLIFVDVEAIMRLPAPSSPRKAMVVALTLADEAIGETCIARGDIDAVLARPVVRGDLATLLSQWDGGNSLQSIKNSAPSIRTVKLASYPNARVLVADDSAVNCEVATAALARFGIVPDLVKDGVEAVEAAKARRFDLILMDGSMPGLDGFEAARQIRLNEVSHAQASTPIIALTADVLGANVDTWSSAGMNGMLHKPFTIAQLGAVLEQFLASAETADEQVREPSAEPMQASVIDASVFAQLATMASPDLAARVIELYAVHGPQTANQISEYFATGDREALAKAAHALKSMSLNIGAKRVANRAHEIEHTIRNKGRMPPLDLIADLPKLVEEACAAMRDVGMAA